jgi:NADPH-dependent 2,4-dienoyl-CoA reductase/sulfur reductase-like enzyme
MMRSDVLVIGAGPAGTAAATAAAESGMSVLLVDENPAPGGQIWRAAISSVPARAPNQSPFARLSQRLRTANVEVLGSSRVIAQPAPNVLRLERETSVIDIQYERLILAAGARERFLPFPGWTLPGVMGAGALQAMVKSGLPIAGKRVVLSGSGPLLLAVASNLAHHGAIVAGIFEQSPFAHLARFSLRLLAHPAKLLEGFQYRATTIRTPYRTSSWVLSARGDPWLQSVTAQIGNTTREIACDYLGTGFHLVPNLELPRFLGCAIEGDYIRVDQSQQTSLPHIYAAGELTGIGGLDKALVEGEIAGLAASGRSASHLYSARDRHTQFARRLDEAFAPRPELRQLADADTIVCRCEDVRLHSLEGLTNGRAAKLHTRCAMGACQGRICGPATQFLFGWQSLSVRPPLTPTPIGTLAREAESLESLPSIS